MYRRYADILGLARSRGPARNFSSSRSAEPTFKNTHRTSPRVGISKSLAIIDSMSVDFDRSDAGVLVGGIVVKIHSMLDSQGPRGRIFYFGPVQGRVDH